MTPKKTNASVKKASKPTTRTLSTLKQETKKKFSLPPLFPPETTREDKMCLLSFCLGMIAMASFFMIDFQIRSYIDMRRWEDRIIYNMQHRDTTAHRTQQMRAGRNVVKQSPNAACGDVLPRTAQFIESEYAPYGVKGDAEIKGSICDALPKGVKCPENVAVFINPVTTYSTEWWKKHWTGRNMISAADKRVAKYNVWTKTNEKGHFEFDDLAAGSYYIGANTCVVFDSAKPCVPVRLGKQISVKDEIKTPLEIVFRADKP